MITYPDVILITRHHKLFIVVNLSSTSHFIFLCQIYPLKGNQGQCSSGLHYPSEGKTRKHLSCIPYYFWSWILWHHVRTRVFALLNLHFADEDIFFKSFPILWNMFIPSRSCCICLDKIHQPLLIFLRLFLAIYQWLFSAISSFLNLAAKECPSRKGTQGGSLGCCNPLPSPP